MADQTHDEPDSRLVYRVDASDTITYVNPQWAKFARENDANSLAAASAVGRSLWDYVSGADTQQVYRHLFAEVRAGRTITVPFRCDSPTLRRYQEMRLTPLREGGIECESRLLKQEVRDLGPLALLETGGTRSNVSITMCSWCKRVQDPVGTWLDLEKAVAVMQLLSTHPPPAVTHGICSSCRSSLMPD